MNSTPLFDYIKCPLNRYTFSVKPIREWVELNCEGKTLNLFAGITKLNIDEVRNDLDPEAFADYTMDALEFLRTWEGEKFDTILLDPPYAYRKSMEMYKGIRCSPFKQLKDEILRVLKPGGKVITFGYHSNTMGNNRGFITEKICLFSHGGAIHDTIASVERYIKDIDE
jgi:tRNA G10  N-methylase Trm11